MPLTPAQKFRQRMLAQEKAQQAKAAGGDPHGSPLGSEYQLMLARLAEHKRKLADIKANEKKAEYKASAIGDFDGWVEGVLEANSGEPDDILSTMLAWNVDAGNFEQALVLAAYALNYGLKMPDQFNRSVPEFLMDEFSKAAAAGRMENASDLLARLIDLTSKADTHDQPRAKLYQAHAFSLIGRLDATSTTYKVENAKITPQTALTALTELKRARELYDKVGGVKDIEKLEKFIKDNAPELLDQSVLPAPTATQAEGEDTAQGATPDESQ